MKPATLKSEQMKLSVIELVKNNPGCTADELWRYSELEPETFVAILIQVANENRIRRKGEQYSMQSKALVDIWWPIE